MLNNHLFPLFAFAKHPLCRNATTTSLRGRSISASTIPLFLFVSLLGVCNVNVYVKREKGGSDKRYSGGKHCNMESIEYPCRPSHCRPLSPRPVFVWLNNGDPAFSQPALARRRDEIYIELVSRSCKHGAHVLHTWSLRAG